MTTYLCTCGTSAAKDLKPRINPDWITAQGGIEPAAQALHRGFGNYRMDDDAALKRQLSAEIHSLARMGVSATDRAVLYSSETPEGQIERVAASAEQLQATTHKTWPGGLRWLKPGQHTRDRYLVSVEDWRLLVWCIVDHDEYEALLQRDRSGKPAASVLDQRRGRYEPFVRMDLYESG